MAGHCLPEKASENKKENDASFRELCVSVEAQQLAYTRKTTLTMFGEKETTVTCESIC